MGKKNEAARMLANLNGPWSNAACMGYCLIAMRRANLRPGAQRRVLMVLEQCFDDVSVEDAEKAGYANTEGQGHGTFCDRDAGEHQRLPFAL